MTTYATLKIMATANIMESPYVKVEYCADVWDVFIEAQVIANVNANVRCCHYD